MDGIRHCTGCGAALPPDAPAGHCLQCLFQLALNRDEASPTGPVGNIGLDMAVKEIGPLGRRMGDYEIRQQLGEGGCGVVYLAEQTEPVCRLVALKLIKPGLDSRQVLARFEAERQVLALMDHPNIAKVFAAGVTDQGRPFFVMELVKGIPITRYCDEKQLPPRERLKLFAQVCQAIQHAHQKGIIHRDIKPSNVLVADHEGTPVPKVIDFGIAKAMTGQQLTDKTLFTAFEQFLGTPAYMSPEQASYSGLDIDTRSDVYSLGVLLYELLTGRTPFDAREVLARGLDEVRRVIREVETQRPSTRLSTLAVEEQAIVARHRRSEPTRLLGLIRGDLDWIALKALEKDRRRRYETANGFAMDIFRHLNNEPVVARPPSNLYRFQKLVRRNKVAFGTGVAVFLALVLGLIGTSVGFMRAEKERRLAKTNQQLAQENFAHARAAVADLLAVSDEDLFDLPGMHSLRVKLMRRTIDRYKSFLERPSADVSTRAELARLYVRYGFTSRQVGADHKSVVLPAYQAAIAIQQQLVREQPKNRTLRADLAWTFMLSTWGVDNRDADSVKARSKAIVLFEALVQENPSDPLARADLAWALVEKTWGATEAEKYALSKRALAIREQLVKEFPSSAEFRRDLAFSLQRHARDWDSALGDNGAPKLDLLTRAIALRTELVKDLEQGVPEIWVPVRPRDSEALLLRPSLMWSKRDLANGCVAAADEHAKLESWPEAIALCERAIEIYRRLTEQNPSVQKFNDELRDSEKRLSEFIKAKATKSAGG